MKRYVSEIFGYPPANDSPLAEMCRKAFICPFTKEPCDPVNKKSNLSDSNGKPLLTHQTGACSVLHMHRTGSELVPVIICPYRLYQKDTAGNFIVFEYIKKKFFPKSQIILVREIGLGIYGRADGMLVVISRENNHLNITNYAHLELQADATTATRELVMCVKDFFDGKDISEHSYSYGLNSKASIKGSSLQMIDKGYLFKYFGKLSIWIIQDTLFETLSSAYNVKMSDITQSELRSGENLIFVVVKMQYNTQDGVYSLKVDKCFSTSPDLLQTAISKKEPINEETILNSILNKINNKHYYQI